MLSKRADKVILAATGAEYDMSYAAKLPIALGVVKELVPVDAMKPEVNLHPGIKHLPDPLIVARVGWLLGVFFSNSSLYWQIDKDSSIKVVDFEGEVGIVKDPR